MRLFVFIFVFFLWIANLNAEQFRVKDPDSLDLVRLSIKKSNLTSKEKLEKMSAFFDSTQSKMDSTLSVRFYHSIGLLYLDVGQYETALEYLLNALRIYELKKYHKGILDIRQSLSNVYYQIDAYDQAKYYANSILKYPDYKEYYSERRVANLFNVLANIYTDMQVYDSAEYYFNKAIALLNNSSEKGASSTLLMIKDNLAQLYEMTGRVRPAIDLYEESLSYYIEDSSYYDICWNANRLANAYSDIGEREKALEYLNMTKEAAKKMTYINLAHGVKITALKLYTKYHINDSLSHAIDEFLELSDSMVQAKISENIQEMQTRYQVEKKEAALQLSQEKSARLDAEVNNQQLWLSVLLIVLALLGGVSIFTYTYYRQKKKVAELELTVKENQLDELLQAQESKAYAAMLRGQDQERERIAQDLHDRLGGTLAALKMSLRKPGNKVGDDDMEILNEAVQEVRSIAHNLSSGVMQKYGLNQAINQLKSTIEKSGGLKFQVFLHPKISILGQGVAIELYRVVQELVNNTIKHSGATEVNLQTNFDGETFNLIYEDNGKGFDPKKVKSGIGLENIKARVKRMNGNLHIDAEKGRGAIFIIELTKSNKG